MNKTKPLFILMIQHVCSTLIVPNRFRFAYGTKNNEGIEASRQLLASHDYFIEDPKVESHNYLIAISERRIPDGGTVYGDKYKPMTETSKKEIASIYDILSKLAKQAFSVIEHYKPKGQKIGHQKAYSTKDLPRKNENCNKDQLLKSVEEKFIVEYCGALGTLEKIMNREGQVYLKRDLQLWIKKLLRVLNHLALFSSEINEEGKRIVRNLLGNHNSLETLKNFLLKLIEPDFAKGDYTGLMDLIDQQTHSIGVDKIWNEFSIKDQCDLTIRVAHKFTKTFVELNFRAARNANSQLISQKNTEGSNLLKLMSFISDKPEALNELAHTEQHESIAKDLIRFVSFPEKINGYHEPAGMLFLMFIIQNKKVDELLPRELKLKPWEESEIRSRLANEGVRKWLKEYLEKLEELEKEFEENFKWLNNYRNNYKNAHSHTGDENFDLMSPISIELGRWSETPIVEYILSQCSRSCEELSASIKAIKSQIFVLEKPSYNLQLSSTA